MSTAVAVTSGWSERSACMGADTELFFPTDVGSARYIARVFCRACPVQEACSDRADEGHEVGLWGGRFRGATHRAWKDLLR